MGNACVSLQVLQDDNTSKQRKIMNIKSDEVNGTEPGRGADRPKKSCLVPNKWENI